MAHTQTTITAPVSTTDVSEVLAVASHNVGYLCSNAHGKINKWSARKPTDDGTSAYATKYRLEDGDYAAANYGLRAPGLSTNYKNSAPGWSSIPVRVYRLGDFNGYRHNATPPCLAQEDKKLYLDDTQVSFSASGSEPPSAGGFSLGEMAALKDMYLGVVIETKDGAQKWLKTSANPLSQALSVTWQRSELPSLVVNQATQTEYVFYVVACSVCITTAWKIGSQLPAGTNTPQYRQLPSNLANLTAALKGVYEYSNNFTVAILGVGGGTTVTEPTGPAFQLVGLDAYIPRPNGDVTKTTFSAGGITILITVKGTGSRPVIIDKNRFRLAVIGAMNMTTTDTECPVRMGPSAFYTCDYTYREPLVSDTSTRPSAYRYTNIAEVDSVTVNPGESKSFLVTFPSLLYFNDNGVYANPTAGKEKRISCIFYYNHTDAASTDAKGSFSVYAKA